MKARAGVDEGEWLTLDPDSFVPGKEDWSLLYISKTGPRGRSGRCWKSRLPLALKTLIVQPVASR